MSVNEARRIELLEAAQQTLGREVAVTLMEMLPPSGWGDVATRQQLDAVERDVHLRITMLEAKVDARCDAIDARCDRIEAKLDGLESRISHELRTAVAEMRVSTIKWAVGSVVSVAGVFTAIGGLLLQFR